MQYCHSSNEAKEMLPKKGKGSFIGEKAIIIREFS